MSTKARMETEQDVGWGAAPPSKIGRRRLAVGLRPTLRLGLAVIVAGACAAAQASPEAPGTPQDHPIALAGGVIHPVSGPEIREGVLLFDGGKIVTVGKDVALPANV